MSPNELTLVAKHVVKLLVEQRYDELEQVTGGVRLSADAMMDAVEDIGAALVMPPPAVWNNLQVTAVRNWPGAFSVHVDLYTAYGRSTHVVEMTVHEKNGKPVIELDDIVQR
jgi:hypothetical protein